MDKNFLKLIPEYYICPYCGKLHKYMDRGKERRELGYYDSGCFSIDFNCNELYELNELYVKNNTYEIFFCDDYLYYSIQKLCSACGSIEGSIPISSIQEKPEKSMITFNIEFKTEEIIGRYECRNCRLKKMCNYRKLSDDSDGRELKMELGFVFDKSDYKQVKEISKKEKETTTMAEKKTSIKKILYEKSPKENFEAVKEFAEKYKPTLKWVVPTLAVYAAYRILNSKEFDLSVNNVSEVCEKELGFKVAFLENKKALKELMTIGGISAGAYGAMKAVSGILGNKEEEDISVEVLEDGMDKVEAISKKCSWIQPKMEDMLPISFSVILVYVVLHKPSFEGKNGKLVNKILDFTEDFRFKIGTYIELAELFIEDKFGINLSDEEEQKKAKICAVLVGLVGVSVFLYGKKVMKKTEEQDKKSNTSEKVHDFVEEAKKIIKKMAPSVYTSLMTFMVSKKLLQLEDEDIWEEDMEDEDVYKEVVEAEETATETGDVEETSEKVTE